MLYVPKLFQKFLTYSTKNLFSIEMLFYFKINEHEFKKFDFTLDIKTYISIENLYLLLF